MEEIVLPEQIILTEDTKRLLKGLILELQFQKIIAALANIPDRVITSAHISAVLERELAKEEEDPQELKQKLEELLSDEGIIQSIVLQLKQVGKEFSRSSGEIRRATELAGDFTPGMVYKR
jgi:hypothetical protein